MLTIYSKQFSGRDFVAAIWAGMGQVKLGGICASPTHLVPNGLCWFYADVVNLNVPVVQNVNCLV